jgi:DNA-binding NarL/FixJ family response regulator
VFGILGSFRIAAFTFRDREVRHGNSRVDRRRPCGTSRGLGRPNLCGTEFEVIAQAADCDQLVRYTLTCNPEVVLTDLRMTDGDSLEAIKEIKTKQPTVRVLVLTVANSIPAMIRAREIGVDGYILKTAAPETLIKVLRCVMRGKRGWNRRQLRQIGTAQTLPVRYRHSHRLDLARRGSAPPNQGGPHQRGNRRESGH